jgi:ATP-binding cassette subfamily F protein 3
LNAFDGTVMLVSHDRALLRSVCDDFWLITKGGIEDFEGDLDDYQKYLLDEAKRKRESLSAASAKAPAADQGARGNQAQQRKDQAAKRQALANQLKPLQKRLTAIEAELASIEKEREALTSALLENPSRDAIADIGKRTKAAEDRVALLEEEWLTVSEQIESTRAEATAPQT